MKNNIIDYLAKQSENEGLKERLLERILEIPDTDWINGDPTPNTNTYEYKTDFGKIVLRDYRDSSRIDVVGYDSQNKELVSCENIRGNKAVPIRNLIIEIIARTIERTTTKEAYDRTKFNEWLRNL